jgi:hypothetical protein
MATSTTGDNPNPPKPKRLAASWDSYRRDVIPANAGAIQVQECYQAFWAGIAALHALLTGTPEDEAEADAYVQEINIELSEFYTDVHMQGVPTHGPKKVSH